MLTSQQVENKLRALKPVLQEKYFVNKIGYFGSFASGDQTEGSDVDILVEFSQPLGLDYFDLEDLLVKEFQRKVDLVSVKALKSQLKEIILRQVKYV